MKTSEAINHAETITTIDFSIHIPWLSDVVEKLCTGADTERKRNAYRRLRAVVNPLWREFSNQPESELLYSYAVARQNFKD